MGTGRHAHHSDHTRKLKLHTSETLVSERAIVQLLINVLRQPSRLTMRFSDHVPGVDIGIGELLVHVLSDDRSLKP
jgi:hypothetical protein